MSSHIFLHVEPKQLETYKLAFSFRKLLLYHMKWEIFLRNHSFGPKKLIFGEVDIDGFFCSTNVAQVIADMKVCVEF